MEAQILTIILNLTFSIWDNVIIPLTLKSSKEIDCFSFNGLFGLAFMKKNHGISKALIKLRPKGSRCLFKQNSAYKQMADKR